MKRILLILLIPICSHASDTLTIGLFNIVPYAFREGDSVIGITAYIVVEIERESNMPIRTILLPYKRMLQYLELGKIDCAIFFLSDYSATISHSLLPLYDLETIVVGKKGLIINSYEDLFDLRLATNSGVNYNAGIKEDKQLKNIDFVKDYTNAIHMLNIGRIDAIVAPKKILQFQMEKLGLTMSEYGKPYTLTVNTAWIQFSKKSDKKALS